MALPEDYNEGTVKKGVGVNGNLKPCQPGQTNNPHGRPLGSRNRSTIVKELLEALHESGRPNVEVATAAVVAKAIAGDVNAWEKLMDSSYGKLTDKSQVEVQATVDTSQAAKKVLSVLTDEQLEILNAGESADNAV